MLTSNLALAAIYGVGLATPSQFTPRQAGETLVDPSKNYINATAETTEKVLLDVSTKASERNATSPLLYGWMIEDINHSIDGGLYAELIANRAFQGSSVTTGRGFNGTTITSSENPSEPYGAVLTGYRAIGGAKLSLDRLHPLSSALPTVMEVEIPLNASDEVGFLNEGWWGLDVNPQVYNASFYILADTPYDAANLTKITVSLRSNLTNQTWVSQSIATTASNVSAFSFTQLSAQISNNATAPNSNNTFAVTFNASEVAGKTFYFSLISLFPETYKNYPNGMRKDIAQHIKDLNPTFLRFPGGNNLEGNSIATRWIWNNTIGALIDRPGRPGTWDYYNTDGFGLLGYLEWTEALELERVLAIYAGYSLATNGAEGTSYPESAMGEVLQSALDELEYCMGNTSTPYGALRAQHGHPEPFNISYVEIGNEDFFSSTYRYRFTYLYNGLKQVYPFITYISTEFNERDYDITIPSGNSWDLHHYEEPSFFLENFNFFDNWQVETNNSDVTIFVGEYSVFQIDEPTGVNNFSDPIGIHVFYPELLSAIAESVYLLAMERNPNTVRMSSYAPSLQNLNYFNWTPNLLGFTANPQDTVLSVSWYSQSLLAHFRGKQTLPVANAAGALNPLFWAASIDETSSIIYLKVVNAGNSSVPLTTNFDTVYKSVNGTIITTPNVNSFNYRNNQTAITPQPADIAENATAANDSSFDWNVPAFSITVLQFDL